MAAEPTGATDSKAHFGVVVIHSPAANSYRIPYSAIHRRIWVSALVQTFPGFRAPEDSR